MKKVKVYKVLSFMEIDVDDSLSDSQALAAAIVTAKQMEKPWMLRGPEQFIASMEGGGSATDRELYLERAMEIAEKSIQRGINYFCKRMEYSEECTCFRCELEKLQKEIMWEK